ncbi:MAG: glutamate-1-semialdehyde-2,1-aminomutase [Omnitrophica bacterium GWA2_52_12]|nr:MAG: glutamate-1-semialdehyde-2,1-aminomutase [Omnitrophica bacterium GWA2_52_12]
MAVKNKRLFKRAQKHIPSGVNSPVRAFRAVGGEPFFIKRGKGPFVWDENGRRYLDFCASWGPLIFGHAPEGLLKRLARDMKKGTSFGAPTAGEVELAGRIHTFFPAIEKCRLVSSGTEAVMSAIRLARGFTGRKKIIKIDGGYHGHVDSMLVKAGSGGATFGTPDSAGVPEELAALTLTIPFNDFEALDKVLRREKKSIAAFILEPVPANMGVVPPAADYLKRVSHWCDDHGVLLIFDEVITGFRLAKGGAQEVYGIRPDLTCLGKIIGGGLPLAVFGGRADIMDKLAPEGPVYQAGTLSGNPLAVSAALWVLDELEKNNFHKNLNAKAQKFFDGIHRMIADYALPAVLNTAGSMFTLFFTPDPVTDYASAKKADARRYARFFHHCAGQGLYFAPSQFEANFISAAHTEPLLNRALEVIDEALEN